MCIYARYSGNSLILSTQENYPFNSSIQARKAITHLNIDEVSIETARDVFSLTS